METYKQEGKQFFGPRVHKDKKTRFKEKQRPWLLQDMFLTNGVISLCDAVDPVIARKYLNAPRSEWGGIMNEESWIEGYQLHARQRTKNHKIGIVEAARVALKEIKEAIAKPSIPKHSGRFKKPSYGPEKDLIGIDLENRTEWDSGANCWSVKPGCCTDFAKGHPELKDSILAKEYNPGKEYGNQLLPMMIVSQEQEGEFQQALEDTTYGLIDTGAAVEWDLKYGLPTTVLPMRAIWQEVKFRQICDARAANAVVTAKGLTLPTCQEIASSCSKEDNLMKEDVKAGFTQSRMKTKDRHLFAFIFKGKLFALTCCYFGVRDAPEEFQARSSFTAHQLKAKLNLKTSNVYIDDFMQNIGKNLEQEQRIIDFIVSQGWILGRKKVVRPSTKIEILGITIDTDEMKLWVPEEKLQKILQILEEGNYGDTLSLAKLLGKLVSVESAVPLLMIFTRPLYDDLKTALVDKKWIGADERLPEILSGRLIDSSSYKWMVTSVEMSPDSEEMIAFLKKKLASMQGQDIRKLKPNLAVSSDSSEEGFGGRARSITLNGEFDGSLNLVTMGVLPPEIVGDSSTTREIHGFAEVCMSVPDTFIKDASIAGIVDNQSFAIRHWMGTRSCSANRCLIRLAMFLLDKGARIAYFCWVPRRLLSIEDSLSRVEPEKMKVVNVSLEWFEQFCSTLEEAEKPNVDAFADRKNHVLARYASIDGSGPLFNGNTIRWKRDDIPWFFPPLTCLKKSFLNWKDSESRMSYWCLPGIKRGTWWGWFNTSPNMISRALGEAVVENLEDENYSYMIVQKTKDKYHL